MKKLICVILLFSVTAPFYGCTRKQPAYTDILDHPLLSRLPQETIAFLLYDTSSTSYQKLREVYTDNDIFNLARLGNRRSPDGIRLISALFAADGLDLLPAANISAKGSGFFFFMALKNGTPTTGLVASLNKKVNTEARIKAVKNKLIKEGFKVTAHPTGNFGLRIESGDNSSAGLFDTYYLTSDKQMIFLSTSEGDLKQLLETKETDTLKKLKSSNAFKKSLKAIGKRSHEIALGYADLSRLYRYFSRSNKTFPGQINATNVPFNSFLYTQQFDSVVHNRAVISINESKDNPIGQFLAVLKQAGTYTPDMIPANSVMALSLDASVLKLFEKMSSARPKVAGASVSFKLPAWTEYLSEASLAVTTSGEASPFPGVVWELRSDDAGEQLYSGLKSDISSLLTSLKMPLSQMQSTEIAGIPTEYALSPLGIGIYIGKVKDTVVLGSEQSAYTAAVNARSGINPNILSKFTSKSITNNRSRVAAFFLDSDGLLKLLKSVKGTLDMFSGGQGAQAFGNLEQLKQAGRVQVRINYTPDGMILVDSFSEYNKQS
ncbi:MAG: hypothetical protein D6719_12695 [Candidatus Dadabacteria bacterium]|nr:MAG: hypothetical protein D6719_12695 [Candidatus Dadabacteria bacterium]